MTKYKININNKNRIQSDSKFKFQNSNSKYIVIRDRPIHRQRRWIGSRSHFILGIGIGRSLVIFRRSLNRSYNFHILISLMIFLFHLPFFTIYNARLIPKHVTSCALLKFIYYNSSLYSIVIMKSQCTIKIIYLFNFI